MFVGKPRNVTTLIICCALSFASSFAAGKKADKGIERQPFKILKPTIELKPAEGYSASQTLGGVRIELSYSPFDVRPMYYVSVQERASTMESWTGVRVGTGAPVWVGIMPFYQVEPQNVQLGVKITNHLGRVLRLEGVALQFVKDGEALETDAVANTLNKVIILPEKTWAGTLHGPPLTAFGLQAINLAKASGALLHADAVGSEGVLLVGLYDVITELDEASTPKKRSNFKWIFTYVAKTKPEDAETQRWKTRLTPELAQKIVGVHTPEDFGAMLPGEVRE